jgi:hypothetical protein
MNKASPEDGSIRMEAAMNTNVRISLTDEQRQTYKDVFGEPASRANIKLRLATMFFQAMGDEKPRTTALKTVNISDAHRAKFRKKFGDKPKKQRFVLKG